jgi:DNA sulfur modification protein DndD
LITRNSLENIIAKIGINGLVNHLGDRCILKLKELLNVSKEEEIDKALKQYNEQLISLPTKVDINSLSKGEQQIYIMSLYWALVKVSKYEIPFIIDTPYARIDSMHRENITPKSVYCQGIYN